MSLAPMTSLQQAACWMTGARVVGDGSVQFARVHTDTRSVQPGDLFVALRGERFDAHDFLPQAAAGGAVAALAAHGIEAAGMSGIEAGDTRRALGELALGWRNQFNVPLAAVTGSNGKTTVTQMVAGILRAWLGDAALATQGNFNNDIGVPLTLLRLRASHRAAVVEVGMNHPGEVAALAALARPTVALVNNAQREHQEFMHSVQAVAQENGHIISALAADGVAVFPADDAHSALWQQMAQGRRCVRFSMDAQASADVVLQTAVWRDAAWQLLVRTPQGALELTLRMAGRHNIHNALAAVAVAQVMGAPAQCITQALARFEPVGGRSRMLHARCDGVDLTVVDDSYNANPDSMRAAIDMLAALPAPQLLVMGDMGEVGRQGAAFHAEVGAWARSRGIAHLFALGDLSVEAVQAFGAGARHFADMAALQVAARACAPQVRSVLVKGSRVMRMERVLAVLCDQGQGEATCC